MADCPGREDVEALISGRLPPERQTPLVSHLDGCRRCRERLDAASGLRAILPPERSRALPESPALARVMERLQADPDGVSQPSAFPFLEPPARPGFLGRLGAYEIRREIGRGGMGVVFEGFDPALRRTVAVKVLSPLAAVTDEARGRFFREARAVAALDHENIVTVHAADQVHGLPFLVMRYVAGESLADRLRREGRLPFADVVRIGAQAARGLAAAHAQGLVHRDIKPANILLEASTGRALLADFGLVRVVGDVSQTAPGVVLGTPEFMSPEQVSYAPDGRGVDARSDLFSLGVVLHALCSGASPFRGETPLITLERVRQGRADALSRLDPDLPSWFCDVVARLLRKNPAERIASAGELADILEQMHAAPTVQAPRRFWWPVAFAALLGLVTAAGLHPRQGRHDEQAPLAQVPPRVESERTPQPGFVVVGGTSICRSLAEAVAAAGDGDVIEVHGDGPFPTAPVRIVGKRLTIRATGRSRPVLQAEVSSRRSGQAVITADADLRLEGLEFHWAMDGSPGWSEAELLVRCAIASTGGRLELDRCRVVVSSRFNACVGAAGGELVLTNSHFIADHGACAYWRPSPAGFRAEGCQFEGRVAVSVPTAAATLDPPPAPFRLTRNTVVVEKVLQLLVDAGPKQSLGVTARLNLLDAPQLVLLFNVRAARPLESIRPEEMTWMVRSLVEWSEEANLYRRGTQFLACGGVRHGATTRAADVGNLDRWHHLWMLPTTGSVEGVIRFRERAGSSPREPLRLDHVEASGPVPSGVGADADRLGPGGASPVSP